MLFRYNLQYRHSQQYSTDQRKRAHISTPIIHFMLIEPSKQPLACPSRLERIIGDKICALFPWSVLYCRLLVYLDSPVFLVSICSCRLVSLKLVLFGKKMTLLQKIVCDYLVSFKTYNFLNINTSLVIPFTSKKQFYKAVYGLCLQA